MARRLFIVFFFLHFVSFVMPPLVCLTEGICSPATDHSSCSNSPDKTIHSPPPSKNKLPCPNNHSCCSFITTNPPFYFSIPSSFHITPVETSSLNLQKLLTPYFVPLKRYDQFVCTSIKNLNLNS